MIRSQAEQLRRRFIRALRRAKVGERFETGISWSPRHGWRPYQKIGAVLLPMHPAHARAIVAEF